MEKEANGGADFPAGARQASGEQPQEAPEVKAELFVRISADSMTAWLSVLNAPAVRHIAFEDVMAFLKERQITYGICEEDIRSFCESGNYRTVLVCARGDASIDGTDGALEYLFRMDSALKPKEREDGTVDYRNLEMVQNVKKGEVLCRITPPVPGRDGTDICGRTVQHKPGKIPNIPAGENTVLSEDKLSLLADKDGSFEYASGQLHVREVFMVRGDVGATSGNIEAVGSVVVQGDVLEGFRVRAGRDVTVRGMVEGAAIEAQGDILISQGMNGMGHGVLTAGGSVRGKYFENASINAGDSVFTEVMMNCRVTAGGSIVSQGGKSLLLGGSYQAGKTIFAKNIGNANHTGTRIAIMATALSELQISEGKSDGVEELEAKQTELLRALEAVGAALESVDGSPVSDEMKKAQKKVMAAKKGQLEKALTSIKTHIQTAKERATLLCDYKVVAPGVVYPGTKIELGMFSRQIVQENSHTKFYPGKNDIIFAPILPSDTPPEQR